MAGTGDRECGTPDSSSASVYTPGETASSLAGDSEAYTTAEALEEEPEDAGEAVTTG